MRIYLLRHGDSAPFGQDDERTLSEKGVEDIKQLAHFIASFNLSVMHIVHSLKYRTKQTAEIISVGFVSPPALESNPDLDPMAPTSIIIEQIQKWDKDCLLVGHMPFMQRLVSKLTTGNEEHSVILFKPGSMVCLQQIQYDHFSIIWALDPNLVRSSG